MKTSAWMGCHSIIQHGVTIANEITKTESHGVLGKMISFSNNNPACVNIRDHNMIRNYSSHRGSYYSIRCKCCLQDIILSIMKSRNGKLFSEWDLKK